MSKRNIRTKQANRLRKELKRSSPPAHIDTYKWLKSRKYVSNVEEAVNLVLAGCLQVDGEPVGIGNTPEGEPFAQRFISADYLGKLEVRPVGELLERDAAEIDQSISGLLTPEAADEIKAAIEAQIVGV